MDIVFDWDRENIVVEALFPKFFDQRIRSNRFVLGNFRDNVPIAANGLVDHYRPYSAERALSLNFALELTTILVELRDQLIQLLRRRGLEILRPK